MPTELFLPTAPKLPKGLKTDLIEDGDWKQGSTVKALCRVPEAETVHGYDVHIVTNGHHIQPGSTVPLTFDEFDSIICAVRLRQRMDFIAKFGDPDVPKRGVTINVATLPGR